MNQAFPESPASKNGPRDNITAVQFRERYFLNSLDADNKVRGDNPLMIPEPVEYEFGTQNDSWTSVLCLHATANAPNIIPQSALSQRLQEINNDLLGLAPVPYLSSETLPGALTELVQLSREVLRPEEQTT